MLRNLVGTRQNSLLVTAGLPPEHSFPTTIPFMMQETRKNRDRPFGPRSERQPENPIKRPFDNSTTGARTFKPNHKKPMDPLRKLLPTQSSRHPQPFVAPAVN